MSFSEIIQFDKGLKSFVKKSLLPDQQLERRSFEIVVPATGVRSLIRIVRFADGPSFVLRALPGAERSYVNQLCRADQLLRERGVPHARILDVSYTLLKGKFLLLVEEYLAGESLREARPTLEQTRALGEALGRLHGKTRQTWGDFAGRGQARATFFDKDLLRRASNRLRSIGRMKNHGLKRAERSGVFAWFKQTCRALRQPALFALHHGELYPSNVIFDAAAGGAPKLIDYGTLAYGCAGKDLAMVQLRALEDCAELYDGFIAAWRDATLPEVVEETERLAPLYIAYYHLREAAIRLKRAQSRAKNEAASEANLREFQQQWRLLQEFISA